MKKILQVVFFFVLSLSVFVSSTWAFGVVGADGESGGNKQSGVSGMKSGSFYKPMSSSNSSQAETDGIQAAEKKSASGFYKPSSVSNHGGLSTTKSVAKQQNLLSSDISFGKTKLVRSSSASSE